MELFLNGPIIKRTSVISIAFVSNIQNYPFSSISVLYAPIKNPTKVPMLTYTIQDSKLFENTPTYEIELEVDNTRVGVGTNYETGEKLMGALRKCIRMVLSGIQGSNYPIPFSERNRVYESYMKMLHGKEEYEAKRKQENIFDGFHWAGFIHITTGKQVAENPDTNVHNIRKIIP